MKFIGLELLVIIYTTPRSTIEVIMNPSRIENITPILLIQILGGNTNFFPNGGLD